MAKTVLKIEGMSCSHCAKAVENAIGALPGVTGVSVDLKAKTAQIECDENRFDIEAVKAAVKDEGYTVVTE